jgi:hypothetical protein
MKVKTNEYLQTVPMKSLNYIVKEKLAENSNKYQAETKGIKYNKSVYDFRVGKVIENFKLVPFSLEKEFNQILHINQITDKPILFCAVFKDCFVTYKLDKKFFKKFSKKMTFQHKTNIFQQLHITYSELKNNCIAKEIISV